ncbi:GNAT superfamily N-acetyltransferase [Microbacterium sp. SORGH_AS428]|uniref:GNAT family N-acetyltransferase n=1 Tax=Microbacterium sp. SORGH_AS_0428 TaxID=3041788 RepID=UPI0028569E26|nr:GNAT family N-acetyltransferase [Microbacterium sp. SORGH_AS_0428]MDR6200915.1 GNAT superfamily N-acetyltransferase [Microbacterium sp. SORGH_AS_0428]
MDLRIRKAVDIDLVPVAELRWSSIVDEKNAVPATERDAFVEAFVEWARTAPHECYVAEIAGSIRGAAWVVLTERVPSPRALARVTADLQGVYVDPDCRGQGIGQRLIAHVVDEATARGAERVVVHSSDGAVPLYERVGFTSSRTLLHL